MFLTLSVATRAEADINNGSGAYGGGSATKDGGRVVVVVPGSSSPTWPGSSYRGGGRGGASNVSCGFFAVSATPSAVLPGIGAQILDTSTVDAGTNIWLTCRDVDSGDITFENLFTWNPAAPPVLTPPAAVLAQMAVNSIQLPKPGVRTWPPPGSTGLVNLPVWLHVDNWAPLSASAGAGGLTATVEATPVRVEWNMDDGSVTCAGAGSTYDVAVKPDPGTSSCSYTYRHSSGAKADRTFHDAAVIVWRLRWTATNGEGGDLGEMPGPPTTFAVQIEESQALVVPSNS